jgi:hypothetical protein
VAELNLDKAMLQIVSVDGLCIECVGKVFAGQLRNP